jgi:glycosyltransferase involved in cell wall biosynthesis
LSLLNDFDFEYRIAGVGGEKIQLKELCGELQLNDRVRFYGYVKDVPEFLKAADVFLITSLWEGFGLAAVEAMNAGLPVVASDVAGLNEIVGDDGQCGILVKPESADEIAAAVAELSDHKKRIEFGRNAFDRSLSFSKERMVDGYVGGYKKL